MRQVPSKKDDPASQRHSVSRRDFLKRLTAAGGAGLAAPAFVASSTLGLGDAVAASDRITLGSIGLGHRGRYDLEHFVRKDDVQCVAVCDCFADRRARGKKLVDGIQGNTDCVAHRFHEKILERDDIDAVLIATGDRWHGVLSALAARAGKDIYSEKPFCMTIGEGRDLVEVTKRFGTIWQCGTQRRSNASFRSAVNLVRSGAIGRLHTITCYLGSAWNRNGIAKPEPAPDPENFFYDRWLGQAPWAPYSPVRVNLWRMNWDTGGGVIPDMGAHYFDIAQWAHDSEMSGPVEYEGTAEWQDDGFQNVPIHVDVRARYEDGVEIHMMNYGRGPGQSKKGMRFEGDEGEVLIDDFGNITTKPESLIREAVAGFGYGHMSDHIRDFLDSTKTRQLTASNPELAQRAHTICHCANLCLRLGRKLRWNPEAERFVNDPEANRMLRTAMRQPWRV